MLIPDINVLVYAARVQAPAHDRFLAWLDGALRETEPVALVAPVAAGVMRILTNPRVFAQPQQVDEAAGFLEAIMKSAACVTPAPSSRHLPLFLDLCRRSGAKGDLAPDAWLAATAIDLGATLVTADRGFARFPGLRWRHPLD